jgi:hypothetical protein
MPNHPITNTFVDRFLFRAHRMGGVRLTALLFAFTSFFACKTFVADDRISEGVIEFEVTYPKLNESSVLKDFLPGKMVMKFRDNKFHSELSAAFGLFKTNIISFGDGKYFAQTVKLIDKKYAVKFDRDMAQQSNSKLPPIEIEHTNKTKEIAGYLCKEEIVTVNTPEKEVYSIYYTDEIGIEESNWFTQFSEIKGVLLEYQIERYDICTRFSAKSVEAVEVDKDLFRIEDDYEMISEERLNMEMMDIFQEFSDE